MEEKIEEILAIFGNDKKKIIRVMVLYCVIVLIAIVIIWWPEKDNFVHYDMANMTYVKSDVAQEYVESIGYMLNNNKTEDIEGLIDRAYIMYSKKSAKQLVDELKSQGYFSGMTEIRDVKLYEDGNTYIYMMDMYFDGNKKAISIVETKPYQYTIVFDDFYAYQNINMSEVKEGIKFTLVDKYYNMKYFEVNMRIENTTEYEASLDFTSTSGVRLELEDGTTYAVANLVTSEIRTSLTPNKLVNKNFVFEIPVQLQGEIKNIIFNNVQTANGKKNIKLTLY